MSIATGPMATVSVEVGGQELTFETGKLAKQADGAVVVRSGETMILATAVGRADSRPDADFFPLTVDVEERMYAAGKIPGGFFKREGRATERATLTARMIDRPDPAAVAEGLPQRGAGDLHRPLGRPIVNPHDILCINGASAALHVSPLPFLGPVGAVRIGRIGDQLVVNPTLEQTENESSLDLIVVGTRDALTMVEAGADQVPEDVVLEAFALAHDEIRKICDALDELRAPGRQAEVGRHRAHGGARARPRPRDLAAHRAARLREAAVIVDELVSELAPRSRWSPPRRTSSASCRCGTAST